jgi:hypothetical protein
MKTRSTYQRLLETASVIYLYTLMLLSAVSFATNNPSAIFKTMRDTFGFSLDDRFFTVTSIIGAITVIRLLFRRLPPFYSRVLYVFSGLPLAIYTVLVFIYSVVVQRFTVGVVVLPAIYLSFLIIAAAVYRPEIEK